jgi:hypothetical protein
MNKYASLLTAAIASLVVGLGLATAGNAQSPTRARMSDHDYCQSLVKAFHESIGASTNRRSALRPPLRSPSARKVNPGQRSRCSSNSFATDVTVPPRG